MEAQGSRTKAVGLSPVKLYGPQMIEYKPTNNRILSKQWVRSMFFEIYMSQYISC